MPGFTKFAWPSVLLDRKDGKRLLPCTRPTSVERNRMPLRFQYENWPPTKLGSSRIESKPFALLSVGFLSPEAKKYDVRSRSQFMSIEASMAAMWARMSTFLPAIGLNVSWPKAK